MKLTRLEGDSPVVATGTAVRSSAMMKPNKNQMFGLNVYKLYIQREDGDEFLLAARRRQA